ncbi:S8 family serine peptidase [Rhodocaloribacter litoris]|uniref:S8 family peptidase n=1 Tax=Rhodocaloribacter litoris TaxID=2558931 RepID=UPI001420C56B|nr:S8 family serine peptidase [Rhodocaloribacter litoris]QXD16477.1 S8 family serine peptidase [Rhodocaloribacter litoris]
MTLQRSQMFTCALALCAGFTLASPDFLLAQLRKLEEPNRVTQAAIYVDEAGIEHATVINVRFTDQVFFSDQKASLTRAELNPLHTSVINALFDRLEQRYGSFGIEKLYPWARWGDNQRINKRTGKVVTIPDFSQVYVLRFASPVPIDEVAETLSRHDLVSYAEGPEVGYMLDQSSLEIPDLFQEAAFEAAMIPFVVSPNDYQYNRFLQTGLASEGQWGLSQVNAEAAWDISKGDGITIAVTEDWKTSNCFTTPHPDLSGRLDNSAVNNCFQNSSSTWHGTASAGIAGAITNNTNWNASLGWNVSLKGYTWGSTGITAAANDPSVDIINASWRSGNTCNLKIAVHTALSSGKLIVAGNGNGPSTGFNPPVVTYPSGFDFRSDQYCGSTFLPSLGDTQVMAVAASDTLDLHLDYCVNNYPDSCPYNYSPGTDPVNNPTQAFMDVAAPGILTWVLYVNADGSPNGVRRTGTSFAAPMVSALAALILATDNTLTPQQLYEVIIRATDKVGQHTYSYIGLLEQSWNQYFGYGRIDAYHALLVATQNPLPLIAGPSTLGVWEYGTWTADPQYGITPFQYDWYYRYCGETPYGPTQGPEPDCEPWVYAGSGASLTRRDLVDFELKVVVTDDKGKTGESTKYVYVGGSAPSKQATAEAAPRTAAAMPVAYALLPNYPNPFNPQTEIRFALPEESAVELVVYDVMGREVARLVDGVMPSGYHRVGFDAGDLPSGLYVYRLRAGGFAEARHMVLVR